MTELRLILLVIGLVIIALVYFWGTRGRSRSSSNAEQLRQAPQLGDLETATPSPAPRAEPQVSDAARKTPETVSASVAPEPVIAEPLDEVPPPAPAAAPPAAPDKIVMFHLLPLEDQLFAAAPLVAALRAEGLRYGHHGIFHRFVGEGNPGPDTAPIFSVANILKPGSFDLDTLEDTQLKGASLVLVLPGPEDPVAAFADMLATGRRLAALLEGSLVDGAGSPVSRQSAGHMREEIINYQHANNLAHGQDVQRDTT